jgi:hypothetical protein
LDPYALNVFPTGAAVSLISIPFGQILGRALRYVQFRKRLKTVELSPYEDHYQRSTRLR